MLSLCPCVRDDRAEVAQRAAELVKNPLPAMSGGADTRKFGDPVEGWLQRVVDGDECEAVWCCLRERHLYYYAKQPKKARASPWATASSGAERASNESFGDDAYHVDLPTLAGPLRKKAIGRGVILSNRKGWKDRWFKLEGGVLRYFKDDTYRPESMKGEVCLAGCSVARGTADDRKKRSARSADGAADAAARAIKRAMAAARERAAFLFSPDGGDLDAELEQKLLDAFAPEVYEAGDVVVWQGDWGDAYYAVESGAVEILVDGSRPDRMAPITSGGGFGSSRSRAARRAAARDTALEKLAGALTEKVYAGGAVLIKEGEVGDAFYVVNVGVVEVTTKAGFRGALETGAGFGEGLARRRAARGHGEVKSSSASMLVLNKKQFLSIVGPARAVVENATRGSSGG
ncbi:cAMP-dependent protein kinase regulator [Aureococcus anophagefferens]|nr:cAMP-dependent protein kinase regulator [Aureococcus anophagefferens]